MNFKPLFDWMILLLHKIFGDAETAKRNGLDVYGYLLYLLTTLPALGKEPSEEKLYSLLPWSDSLPGYCKTTYSEIL